MSASEKPAPEHFTDSSPAAEARCRVVVVDRVSDLDPYIGAWTTLAKEALEPNVFFEPWFLRPALKAFADPSRDPLLARRLCLVAVFGEPAGPPTKVPRNELWGIFPLERKPAGGALPVSHFRLFQHDYSYLPTPLLHRTYARPVLTAFFDWLESQKRCQPLLAIDDFPVDGPFHQLLVEEVGRRRAQVLVRDRWTRAVLRPDCDAETYEARALAGKHRKELRRQKRRLGEVGKLEFNTLGPDSSAGEAESWLQAFMSLEASGWKGREGTALGSRIPDALFFKEMSRDCHAAGKLAATAVRLDGRALVMQILLRCGAGAFAYKIGYDESFARYSPGVLLELDLVERVANGKMLAWIDSAATRDHPMINRLWTERRAIERWVIGLDPASGLWLAGLPMLQWGLAMLRKDRETKK